MADSAADKALPESAEEVLATDGGGPKRKEKRKALKKLKRKQARQEAAIRERVEEEARANDPEQQLRIRLKEQEEAQAAERERRAFEEHERLWIEAAAARRAEEEAAAATRRAEEEAQREKNKQMQLANELEEGNEWEYVEEGPAEIIWQGNEIIVKKKKVRILKRSADQLSKEEDDDRPTSNPLPPQSAAFASHNKGQSLSEQRVLENVAQQIPNFGTEQDKAHCPFHLKTGACRFGPRCSRVHFYPDKSCTLLIRNMYNGPGLAWEQDEGLEYTDEEVECCYEEFYEDVHTEFLKFGELVNFKVCKNGSHHLRGNVYVHYKSLESAILAYNAIYGRFFAGKQITCEFVGVTRWKIAICGEYMKSRFRTCSHGSACNFIHCFRNPGGDYEWADSDNPPPKYWIKKMGALFGPSVELGYDEPMNLEHEKPRVSSRKNTPTSLRRQSGRSTYADRDMHDSGSGREDSDGKEDVCRSHLPRREHSRKRKGTAFLSKHEQYEEKHISEVHGYNAKYSSRSHDSGEGSFKEQDRFFPKSNHKFEEKCGFEDHERHKKHKPEEGLSRQKKGEAFFHEQGKSENNYKSKSHERNGKEHRSSDWNSDDSDDNRDRSNNPSSKGSYDRHGVDAQERYDGRYCSSDLGSDKNSLENTSCHSKYYNERTEFVRYSSQNHESHVSHDHGREGKTSRVRKKEESGNQKFSSDGSSVDWKTGDKDPGCEESLRKNSRSGKMGKHHRRKEERMETEEQGNSSDSDSLDSNRRAYKKHSRSRTPMCSSRSSRSDRSHKSNKES